MNKEQIRFILNENKLHDIEIYKFILKKLRQMYKTNDIEILSVELNRYITKLLCDDDLLEQFTKQFNLKLLRKKLSNHDSLDVEEKLLIDTALNKLSDKHRYILLQVLQVGRSQSDVSDELNLSRIDVSKIINTSLETLIEIVGEELWTK